MKPLTETTCPHCALIFLANDHEIAPNQIQCPRCGNVYAIEYPPSFAKELGCGPLAIAAVVLFALATAAGGGGILGILLGIVLGLGIPAGIAYLAYCFFRWNND